LPYTNVHALATTLRGVHPPLLPQFECARLHSAQLQAEADAEALRAAVAVRQAFPSCTRSILTEIYLCHPCSCHGIEDGNARTGRARALGLRGR
jgi:hypothetical protein